MKKINTIIATAFSKENYFRTCILVFLAIITVCAVFAACSIVAIPGKLDAVEKKLAGIQKAQEREAAAFEEHNRKRFQTLFGR